VDALGRRIERRLVIEVGILARQKGHDGAATRGGSDPEAVAVDDDLDDFEEEVEAEAGRRVELAVDADAGGSRLDRLLAAATGESRSRVQALIRAGRASLDGRPLADPGRRLKPGERVALDIPPAEPALPVPEAIPLAVVHEDADLIVVDKPAGLVVHPAPGHRTGTLVNALLHHCGDALSGIGGVRRPGIVHRLDKDTSGLLVAAKTDRAHRALAAQFADHGRTGALERAYLALVWGTPRAVSGTIDAPLGRASANRMRQAVARGAAGRHAVTHYRVLERFGDPSDPIASLVECRLETGRTHQIRVHMAHIGAPLVGDRDYGAGFRTKAARLPEPARGVVERFPRQALHAALLAFEHPATGAVMRFESGLPADMAGLVAAFRGLAPDQ
jgi:23S rRNA pseudouridine1911/1915/1917 synthase